MWLRGIIEGIVFKLNMLIVAGPITFMQMTMIYFYYVQCKCKVMKTQAIKILTRYEDYYFFTV